MKRLNIKVVPNAAKERIIEENGVLKIYVNAPAADGKANEAVIESLSEHFAVKKRDIRIIRGQLSRNKTVEIG
jgi:uncharacterized protein (TIGR00251 family)